MSHTLMLIGMMLVTFPIRYIPLAFLSRIPLPELIERSLRYVPSAVLTAIIVPEVFMPDDVLFVSYRSAPLIAAIVAGLVSWRTKSLLLTIIIGMLTLWGWGALF